MTPVLEIKNLAHTYPSGVKALKDISLSINKGEILGVIGQNGSGKTTLVRHFNGLLKPTNGRVYLNGKDTSSQRVGDMSRQVGYVFQNPNHQIFSTTVENEILVAPKNFGFSESEKKEGLERVCSLLNLTQLLEISPMTLDYTTKKLLTIASVLVFSPEILILDEPTGGLDEVGRKLLSNIIEMMRKENYTVIIISHDMDYMAEHTDRIIVMAQGEILKDDTPEKIFNDADILKKAWIEPPQITQLDLALDSQGGVLTVEDFKNKYKNIGLEVSI